MRRPGGYATTTDPLGTTIEEDTFTCNHCNSIVFVKPKMDAADCGGLCKMCMGNICPKCTGKSKCIPFEKKLDQMEARERFLKSVT